MNDYISTDEFLNNYQEGIYPPYFRSKYDRCIYLAAFLLAISSTTNKPQQIIYPSYIAERTEKDRYIYSTAMINTEFSLRPKKPEKRASFNPPVGNTPLANSGMPDWSKNSSGQLSYGIVTSWSKKMGTKFIKKKSNRIYVLKRSFGKE